MASVTSRVKNVAQTKAQDAKNKVISQGKDKLMQKGNDLKQNAVAKVTGSVTGKVADAKGKLADAKGKLADAKSKLDKAKNMLNGNALNGLLTGALGILGTKVMGKLIGKLQKVPALGILTKSAKVATLMVGVASAIKLGSSALTLMSKQSKSGKQKDTSLTTVANQEKTDDSKTATTADTGLDKTVVGKTGNANATPATYKEYDATMPLEKKVNAEVSKEYQKKMITKMNKTVADNMAKEGIKPKSV